MNVGKALLLAVPTLAVLVAGCAGGAGAQPGAPAPVAQAVAQGYTGEELYRGIMLQHGRVAFAIPEIRDNLELGNFISDKGQLKAAMRANDLVVAAVRKEQPQFFDGFKVSMESGDHLRIRQALFDAAAVTRTAIGKMPGNEGFEKKLQEQGNAENPAQSFAELKAATKAKLAQAGVKVSPKRPNDICVNCDDDGGSGDSGDSGGDVGGDEGGDIGGDEGGDVGGDIGGDDGGGPVAGLQLVWRHAVVVTEVALAAVLHVAAIHNIAAFTIVAVALAAVVPAAAAVPGNQASVLQEQLVHSIAVNLKR
jgi:SdpC family antimicrobial peptide